MLTYHYLTNSGTPSRHCFACLNSIRTTDAKGALCRMPAHLKLPLTAAPSLRRLPALLLTLLAGATAHAGDPAEQLYGPASTRERIEAMDSAAGRRYLGEVQPLLERRCVVCHGCYDSPCQLNLAAPEGIDRGASKDKVYESARLKAAPPSRLIEDASTTMQWRQRDFYPVLNEHAQQEQANIEASVMYHMLDLKRKNPLPDTTILPDSFELGLNREQACPRFDEFEHFSTKYPLWGMPYGLPGLAPSEFGTLEKWLKDGARMAHPAPPSQATLAQVDRWERFLNGSSPKERLMSRYLYEHWFLAHLYFRDQGDGAFFRITRSATPPGTPIRHLPSRRPYEAPGTETFYYRLWRDRSTTLDKTHMPYALDDDRMAWLRELFLAPSYAVESLPSYEPEVAANPFIAFSAIPLESRWRFLLEEAQFTVMNFIKGPVCRGQVALNVIRDNFWVVFTEPKLTRNDDLEAFFNSQEANLRMPVEAGSTAPPFSTWHKYAKSQEAYLKAKTDYLSKAFPNGEHLTLDIIWDGDGHNQNAALTVFRHFDSATVVKGLVGPEPLTAWLVNYSILERIHYLLVAGFDVFGNMGHQLTTRLYMDFLRMEGEFNFLALLPPETRLAERQKWYRGASKKQQSYLFGARQNFEQPTGIHYTTDDPKHELYDMLRQKLGPVLNQSYSMDQPGVPPSHRRTFAGITDIRGAAATQLPEMAFINVQGSDGRDYYYTLLRNSAHSNITSLFKESSERAPDQDTITLVAGFLGSYPSVFWRVQEKDLPTLVGQIRGLYDEAGYRKLLDRYGVRRTAPDFWAFSDKIMAAHQQADPIENGLLDYNRLENR